MRPSLEAVKAKFKDHDRIIGVEVGVMRGGNAGDMLANIKNLSVLYLVDPWKIAIKHYGVARIYLEKYGKRVIWHERTSVEACALFKEAHLFVDFVYIDGDHTRDAVKQDIRCWYDQVKKGGILGGHDYSAAEPGVNQAVDEFIKATGFKLFTSKHDWWIIK